jgi:hypothetical protein
MFSCGPRKWNIFSTPVVDVLLFITIAMAYVALHTELTKFVLLLRMLNSTFYSVCVKSTSQII